MVLQHGAHAVVGRVGIGIGFGYRVLDVKPTRQGYDETGALRNIKERPQGISSATALAAA
jgi:hypothetical protein